MLQGAYTWEYESESRNALVPAQQVPLARFGAGFGDRAFYPVPFGHWRVRHQLVKSDGLPDNQGQERPSDRS